MNNYVIKIGTQGWNYEGWIGSFYPRAIRPADFLTNYAKIFDTVEVDSTFYAVPAASVVESWKRRTPPGFTFSLKLPSEITHKNRLRASEEILAQFCHRARMLGPKLAAVLIQFPPDFSPNEIFALANFLSLLPPDIRFAVEFRDREWITKDTLHLLRSYKVALALADSKWVPRELSFRIVDQPTADFAYVRWLGPRELTDFSHVQIDRTKEFRQWAEAFDVLRQNVNTIYGYLNNHYQGHSPASCNIFKKLLGLKVIEPDALVTQPSLF